MKTLLAIWLSLLCVAVAQAQTSSPFESGAAFTPAGELDALVLKGLQARKLAPANQCSDGVFVRRVCLDLIGTLPTPQEAQGFLADQAPDKRAKLIEALLQRPEFADYWALKWCDLLRVKAEFPINLWPNAVQAYHRWIYEAVRDNKPYDQFARELLTSSGSNFRVPPVNFYRALQGREPAQIAAAVALTFMGTRLDSWPPAKRKELEACFSRVAYKKTGEWKEEIVQLDPTALTPLDLVFPDGAKAHVAAGQDPREVFANWLLKPDNFWFARSLANRVWSWFMARGIVHEPDDLRTGNPPVNPELLGHLTQEFIQSKYDLRHLFRLILNSQTYQQSPVARGPVAEAEKHFAVYPVRRLDAPVLIDALTYIAGDGQGYTSPIPEPFTFIPEAHRAISLADGSITSSFLEMFGRSPRDTGLESERTTQTSDAQRLFMLNSAEIQRKLTNSRLLQKLTETARGNVKELVSLIYLGLLSRRPTPAESAVAEKRFQTPGLSQKQAVEDLAWALINGKEFLYRH